TFTPVSGSIAANRFGAAATLLRTGEVLIAGGTDVAVTPFGAGALATAILYDPSANSFVNLPDMTVTRDHATATLLPNGKVLIAGGTSYQAPPNISQNPVYAFHASAELFNPRARTFSKTGAMVEARAAHTATPLPNGSVLMAGGYNTIYGVNNLDAETNAIYY